MEQSSIQESATAPSSQPSPPDLASLALQPDSFPQPTSPTPPPPHRSHSPSSNLKRSDPFKFGSRYLLPTDDPFEYNAWDHVAPDPTSLQRTEAQLATQRANPVSDYDRLRFNADPQKWWNRFYTNNTSNFFKDRKWLAQEFSVLKEVTRQGVGRKVVLEVGAGAGNTAFPIMRGNENAELVLHACDFSRKAVELIRGERAGEEQRCGRLEASVWDVAGESLPEGVEEGSVDVVLLIFVFSALSPRQWEGAVRNVWRVLKEGGEVCFRDYGRGDLAQVRFRKGRWMEENFYVRGDGTRVYFFGEEELRGIWEEGKGSSREEGGGGVCDGKREEIETQVDDDFEQGKRGALHGEETKGSEVPAFEVASLGADRRMIVNRQRRIKMYRCWMQGRFRKVVGKSTASIPSEKEDD